jgi:hypothetical protein
LRIHGRARSFVRPRAGATAAGVLLLAVVLGPITPSELRAQTVVGRLLDRETGEGIGNATVTLLLPDSSVSGQTTSNSDGLFELRGVGEGTYRVKAERIGYFPRTSEELAMAEGDRIGIEMHLSTEAIELESVTVVVTEEHPPGALGGFYDRRGHSVQGRFATRDQWEGFDPTQLTNILAMNGVLLGRDGQPRLSMSRCVRYVIDGVRIPDDDYALRGMAGLGSGVNGLVPAQDVEAIEIYPSYVHVPLEFAGPFNECGAIVIWTRYSR